MSSAISRSDLAEGDWYQVIIHSSPEALAAISDTLWTPLFEHYDHEEESSRNVAADCIGHLTTSNPSKYLPQLQSRLGSSSAHERATVIAALRFTFTNDSTSYDELLAPLIVEFFKLMKDSDLVSLFLLSSILDKIDSLLIIFIFSCIRASDVSHSLRSIQQLTTSLTSFATTSRLFFPNSTNKVSSIKV